MTRNRRPFTLRTGVLKLTMIGSLCLLSGCNYAILLGYLIGGPPSIEPDFTAQLGSGKDMKNNGVTVAVVCTSPEELKFSYDELDNLVAEAIALQLGEKKISVILPDQVRAWLDKNRDWTSPKEIGEAFGTTYVIHVDILDYSLFEKDSSTLYRGKTECEINVWEMAKDGSGDGEKIYSKQHSSVFPLRIPRSSQETTLERFKKEYLYRLSYEIGRHFFEYHVGDDISDAT
ncbi:MAG TPA: hypothetical protein VMM56_15580 [Planctomycetaceae bacterium]|nr:hypothetical protein [Planctomycetaceae bacterium]